MSPVFCRRGMWSPGTYSFQSQLVSKRTLALAQPPTPNSISSAFHYAKAALGFASFQINPKLYSNLRQFCKWFKMSWVIGSCPPYTEQPSDLRASLPNKCQIKCIIDLVWTYPSWRVMSDRRWPSKNEGHVFPHEKSHSNSQANQMQWPNVCLYMGPESSCDHLTFFNLWASLEDFFYLFCIQVSKLTSE